MPLRPRPSATPSPTTPRRRALRPFLATLLALTQCAAPHGRSPEPDRHIIAAAAKLGLVDVRSAAPGVAIGLRYAGPDNFTRQAVYPADMPCLLHPATAAKLARAQRSLEAQGLGLKVWDAWRPPEVQKELFRFGEKTGIATLFVNPREAWSFHCAGVAVDITLVDSDGAEVPMPSNFDEAGPGAHAEIPLTDEQSRSNLHALQAAMKSAGFDPIDIEWWHFDDHEAKVSRDPLPAVNAAQVGLRLPRLKEP